MIKSHRNTRKNTVSRRSTVESNIPILYTHALSYDASGDCYVYTFGDSTCGIRKPFKGLFMLVTGQLEKEVKPVAVDNIYGAPRIVYHNITDINGVYQPYTADEWPGIGYNLMHYDTDLKKLFLIE